tara:strand:- start:248 stop:649 length:402 start_codon:yes stop_codon:yes gene_type:complete
MREKIKKLIERIRLKKLTESQESLIHDHINVELLDYSIKDGKVLMLAACLILFSCLPIEIQPKPHEYEGVPVVDSKGEEHYYTTTQTLDLGNDYGLYCRNHHRWETISVRYIPTAMTKLRKEEYIVRAHPKNG